MLPRINSISFTVTEDKHIPEGWIESEARRRLTELIKDKIRIEYWDTHEQKSSEIVAKIAVLSMDEYCELMNYIDELEAKVRLMDFALENKDELEGVS